MNEHVVEYQSSSEWGMLATLEPHHGDIMWHFDGVSAEPHKHCSAIAESTDKPCEKREAIVMIEARTKNTRRDAEPGHELHMCGSHFIRHRNGDPVTVVVTPARAR